MKLVRLFLINSIFVLIAITSSYGQDCITIDRSLFHMLSSEVGDTVNCTDVKGLKQGWWLEFKLDYHEEREPDIHDTGIYVDEYRYGKYENDKPIGEWLTIYNVHLIFVTHVDSFSYRGDSTFVRSIDPFSRIYHLTTFTPTDTLILYENSELTKDYPVIIDCNTTRENSKECILSYRDVQLKKFEIEAFGIESIRARDEYIMETKRIDYQLSTK
jgi:hypothetical protein